MREIKFRAWDNSIPELKNIMVYFDLSTDNRWIYEKKIPIMQFTNTKDKLGKDIYEGDILSGHSDGLVVVEWANASWECVFDNEGNSISLDEMCYWFGNSAIVEGNIYENPKLMEGIL